MAPLLKIEDLILRGKAILRIPILFSPLNGCPNWFQFPQVHTGLLALEGILEKSQTQSKTLTWRTELELERTIYHNQRDDNVDA